MKRYIRSVDVVSSEIPVSKYEKTITFDGKYSDYTPDALVELAKTSESSNADYVYTMWVDEATAKRLCSKYFVSKCSDKDNMCRVSWYVEGEQQ